ncbi:MAG: class II aldolase/adducin family protein [Clostridiaceae bacterium]|nr:class II aldolase/adducin family protein [Clostridiaceae bacterium]
MTNDFLARNQTRLADFVRMSQCAGSRSDFVQGGGGNTSCKLDKQLMAIKASGFRLDQITENQAYAVLDYQLLRDFYQKTDPAGLADVEKEGSAQAKSAIKPVEGLPSLRPSVEAGFHSLLETYVLHTHPVYANLAACSAEGPALAAAALADMPAGFASVPYINPGAQLTFAIDQARKQAAAAQGKLPAVILMQNHGLIVTADDIETCLAWHEEANRRIAAAYHVSSLDWPVISLEAASPAAPGAEAWCSATGWLHDRLLDTAWDLDFFTGQPLYPDQLVFLGGQVGIAEKGSLNQFLMDKKPLPDKCTLFRETGEVYYQCGQREARTLEETLCAILFIVRTIRQAGMTVCTMSEAGRSFIDGWESEKYRKNLAAK